LKYFQIQYLQSSAKKTAAECAETFHQLTKHHWGMMRENITLKKKKKFCTFRLRKGLESGLVYKKFKELASWKSLD
jgi:hypothetical protein